MAEYLSPGVYVEEFDAGIKAMEGVGTSTAGFIGMAQKGPVRGLPVLITSMADYQRHFGGYLPENTYKEMRYLPYAVEQFFNNGGSACYVMRVCKEAENTGNDKPKKDPADGGTEKDPSGGGTEDNPSGGGTEDNPSGGGTEDNPSGGGTEDNPSGGGTEDNPPGGGTASDPNSENNGGAVPATGRLKDKSRITTKGEQFVTIKAANPGSWGNRIQASFSLAPKGKVPVKEAVKEAGKEAGNNTYTVEGDVSIFQKGDLVWRQSAPEKEVSFGLISSIEGSTITLKWKMRDNGNEEIPMFFSVAEWNLAIGDDTLSEQYERVSFNPDRSNYIKNVIAKSLLVTAEVNQDKLTSGELEKFIQNPKEPVIEMTFEGGGDGKIEFDASLYLGKDGSPDMRTGLKAFQTISDVSIMAIPGITNKSVQSALVSHCEGLASRFAVLDMPSDAKEVAKLQEFRENVDSSYAAMYHPWLQCYDPLANRNVFLPPSGSIAGIYGRTDNTRGVHKAPANEIVRNCTGLSVRYNDAEQGKLNPKGINLIRALPGQGIRVWGARTCSSDGNWKYINVRRLFIFIEESIKANTNWAVFEPNDEMLWSRVEGTIRVFLTTQWRNGALMGSTADEAFFINIGRSTMTQDDILNGRLICVIGVAPVRPAEFVIFRITQKMESAQ